jgi:hypothetical protein
MKKFTRQPPVGQPAPIKLDLRAAAAQSLRILPAGTHKLRVEAARLARSNAGNPICCLYLTTADSEAAVDVTPLVIGSTAVGLARLVAQNQRILAHLLELAGVNIDGEIDVREELQKLVGLVFHGKLSTVLDNRNGLDINKIEAVVAEDAP